MRIPPKKELERLQAKCRTDKKIGEVLGGVPAHLVAYWRKKKKIPDCELPKYTEKQITNLWETWGSDKKAAAQLGITPAAFYKWRKKYGLKEKPKVLKSSQMEFSLFTDGRSGRAAASFTLLQKIVEKRVAAASLLAGDRLALEPDMVVISGNWEKILDEWQNSSGIKVRRPDRIWAVVPDQTCKDSLPFLARIRQFLKENQVRNVLSQKEGDYLQILLERKAIPLFSFVVGTDRSIATCGFVGSWGYLADAVSIRALFESGKISPHLPGSLRVELKGRLPGAVFTLDLSHFLKQQLGGVDLKDKVLEVGGEVLANLSLSQRFSLASALTKSLSCGVIFPVDQAVKKASFPKPKGSLSLTSLDPQAAYLESFEFDVSHLEPLVKFSPQENISSVRLHKKFPLSQIILGASPEGRLEELAAAARILENRKVHPSVEVLVVPASRAVLLSALKRGYLRTLLEAGCHISDPALVDWEKRVSGTGGVLSTTALDSNHHEFFSSRQIILASPATAAASAIRGEISDPRDYL